MKREIIGVFLQTLIETLWSITGRGMVTERIFSILLPGHVVIREKDLRC